MATGVGSGDMVYAESADKHFHPETLVTFEMGFEIMPGTAGTAGKTDLNPYEVAEGYIQSRGE